jgi:hypothetical protein
MKLLVSEMNIFVEKKNVWVHCAFNEVNDYEVVVVI